MTQLSYPVTVNLESSLIKNMIVIVREKMIRESNLTLVKKVALDSLLNKQKIMQKN